MARFDVKFRGDTRFGVKFRGDSTFSSGFNGATVVETGDYEKLNNKPRIENHELVGNSTIDEIGVGTLTVQEIEKILYLN